MSFELKFIQTSLALVTSLRALNKTTPWGYDYASDYYQKVTVSLPGFLAQPSMVGFLETNEITPQDEQARENAIVYIAKDNRLLKPLVDMLQHIARDLVPEHLWKYQFPFAVNISTHHGVNHVDTPESDGPGQYIIAFCVRYPTLLTFQSILQQCTTC
jgi:hypothetical protein